MKVVLELHQQNSKVRRVTVRHDIVIGRGSKCNLQISVPEVSRRHCFLRINARKGVSITDLESSNGTWLNGQRTVPGKSYTVEDGMILAIGPVRFITHISDGKTDDNNRTSTELNSMLSSNAMDISSGDSEVSSKDGELNPDYTTNKPEPLVIDSSEIELVDSDSKAVILLDEATEVMDQNISEEKIDNIDDLLLIEDIDDGGADALQDFLQNND
jgi:pSer/pThr/pTyr-binding forkhead associated (FHA) protein